MTQELQKIKIALSQTEKHKLYFVWELYKQVTDLKKGTMRFANKHLTWYIGKESELKTIFPDTEETTFGFCNSSIPIIYMKSRSTEPSTLEAKAFIGQAFAEGKKTNTDMSDYEEWLIYEKNMQNSKIICEQCETQNQCDQDMNFSGYCNGVMKWKGNEVNCWATFNFNDHAYKISEYDLKRLKQTCFDDEGQQCWINACCKLGHKDHDLQPVKDDDRRKLSGFITTRECKNCGSREVKPKKSWTEIEDGLFKLFVDQYMAYWDQQHSSSRSIHRAKAGTDKQREIHNQIKAFIEGDPMIVQKCLQRAEERYGKFSDKVYGVTDRQEALAKVYDYAEVSTRYMLDYELGRLDTKDD